MAILLVILLALIVLDLAARRWGVDSSEDFNSSEWSKREEWGVIQISGQKKDIGTQETASLYLFSGSLILRS